MLKLRYVFSTTPPPLRPGEQILASDDSWDEYANRLQTRWWVASGWIDRERKRRRVGAARHSGRRVKKR